MTTICAAELWLKWVSGGFAFVAACVWLAAWRVKLPGPLSADEMRQNHQAVTEPVAALMRALTRQSALNGWAALLTAVAAAFQVALAFMPICWG